MATLAKPELSSDRRHIPLQFKAEQRGVPGRTVLDIRLQGPPHKFLEALAQIKDNPREDGAFAVISPLRGFPWPPHAITMPLSFWIAVGTSIAVLLLGLLLKVKGREIQVLEALVDPNAPLKALQSKDQRVWDEHPTPQGEETNAPSSSPTSRIPRDCDLRRSSRIERPVPLLILGANRHGETFQEKTSAVAVNLHGCCYPSLHDYAPESWVTLQVTGTDGAFSPVVRARVRSFHSPQTPREICQVGVELEIPGNVWGIPAPPEDWLQVLEGTTTTTELAPAAAPAPEPEEVPEQAAAAPEWRHSGVTEFPASPPAATAAQPEPAKEAAHPKLERVTITMDQLIAALQGKLQRAAEKAVQAALQTQLEETLRTSVQAAVTTHLDEAVRQALCKIDEISSGNVRQAEAVSTQRLEDLMRASQKEIFNHLESRVGELQGRWEDQQESYRSRAEEIIQRLEKLGADTQRDLAETHKLVEKLSLAPETQTHPLLEQSIGRAAEEFETAATRVSDRQLVRLIEDKQMVTREASAQLEACAAEAGAMLQNAANSTLEEFRRSVEVQMDLILAEAKERVTFYLASLDAESRAAVEARRRALETDVARTAEQSTMEFRSSIKTFLYSCLVAAVGAVDQHAQTTLAGLSIDPNSLPRVLDTAGGSSPRLDDPPAQLNNLSPSQ